MLILLPQTCIFLVRKLLLYIFKDNEAVVKMIIKVRSPTVRHVSRTHRVALDWLFDRINVDPKIQIKHIDTKNQLADILTKGNFTRDEWNHLLVCSTSAISVPSVVLKRCRKEHKKMQVKKESQQNQSRWWIWSHDTAWRIRTCLPRLYRKARGKSNLKVRTYLWASLNVQQTSTVRRPALGASSSNFSEWNIDDKWSQVGNLVKCRTQVRGDPKMTSLSSMMIWTLPPLQNRTVLHKIQCKTSTNVLWFGECLCLQHWEHLYSWERITQTMSIPSKIQEKISL